LMWQQTFLSFLFIDCAPSQLSHRKILQTYVFFVTKPLAPMYWIRGKHDWPNPLLSGRVAIYLLRWLDV